MSKKIEIRENKATKQPKWFDIIVNDKVIGYMFKRSGSTIWEVSHNNGGLTDKYGTFEKAIEEIAKKENVSSYNIKIEGEK